MDIPAGMDASRISELHSVEQSRAANMNNGLFPAARCHRVLSPGSGSWVNQSAVGSETPRRSSRCETGYCPFQSVRWPIGQNHEQRIPRPVDGVSPPADLETGAERWPCQDGLQARLRGRQHLRDMKGADSPGTGGERRPGTDRGGVGPGPRAASRWRRPALSSTRGTGGVSVGGWPLAEAHA